MADALTLVDASGASTPFDGSTGFDWLYGVNGRFMPPMALVTDEVPGQAGSRLRAVRTLPREVVVPLDIVGTSETDLRTKLRTLARSLDPGRGDVKLRSTAPDAAQRELVCRYTGGFGLAETEKLIGNWITAALVFYAADPYWLDVAATTQTAAGVTLAFFPLFPLRLTPTTVAATFSVDNTGDVATWPTWTLTGPATNLVLTNTTTGKVLTLTYTLAAGRSIVINTNVDAKTVLLDDATNLFANLSATSALFPLAAGTNSITVSMTGTSGATSLVLSYKRRWLAP